MPTIQEIALSLWPNFVPVSNYKTNKGNILGIEVGGGYPSNPFFTSFSGNKTAADEFENLKEEIQVQDFIVSEDEKKDDIHEHKNTTEYYKMLQLNDRIFKLSKSRFMSSVRNKNKNSHKTSEFLIKQDGFLLSQPGFIAVNPSRDCNPTINAFFEDIMEDKNIKIFLEERKLTFSFIVFLNVDINALNKTNFLNCQKLVKKGANLLIDGMPDYKQFKRIYDMEMNEAKEFAKGETEFTDSRPASDSDIAKDLVSFKNKEEMIKFIIELGFSLISDNANFNTKLQSADKEFCLETILKHNILVFQKT